MSYMHCGTVDVTSHASSKHRIRTVAGTVGRLFDLCGIQDELPLYEVVQDPTDVCTDVCPPNFRLENVAGQFTKPLTPNGLYVGESTKSLSLGALASKGEVGDKVVLVDVAFPTNVRRIRNQMRERFGMRGVTLHAEARRGWFGMSNDSDAAKLRKKWVHFITPPDTTKSALPNGLILTASHVKNWVFYFSVDDEPEPAPEPAAASPKRKADANDDEGGDKTRARASTETAFKNFMANLKSRLGSSFHVTAEFEQEAANVFALLTAEDSGVHVAKLCEDLVGVALGLLHCRTPPARDSVVED